MFLLQRIIWRKEKESGTWRHLGQHLGKAPGEYSEAPLKQEGKGQGTTFDISRGHNIKDTQTPTKWRKLTVCCPQASQPQTTWKQKVDDAAFSLPHHRPWVGKQCETPHYHHQAGTHSLKALPAVALFAWPNSKANFFLLHPTLP